MSGTGDLQALLASLKASSSPPTTANGQSTQQSFKPSFDPNSLLHPQTSPALSSHPATHQSTLPRSNMTSPATQGGAGGSTERTQSLLNLLKFSQPAPASTTASQPSTLARSTSESQTTRQETTHGKSLKASDLMSSFFSPPNAAGSRSGPNTALSVPIPSSHIEDSAVSKMGNTAQESSQDALLKLLKRSTSSSNQHKSADARKLTEGSSPVHDKPIMSGKVGVQTTNAVREEPAARRESPIRMFGSSESREATPFEPPSTVPAKESKPIFTYTNPFEVFHASRNVTPQPSGPRAVSPMVGNGSKAHQSNGNKRNSIEATPEQPPTRRKLTPRRPLRSSSSVEAVNGNESVPGKLDAVMDLTEKAAKRVLADVDIKEEPEEAGVTQAEIDEVADKLEKTAIDAAVEVKKELDKEENKGVLEEQMSKPMADAVKELIDDAAAEVASVDSWQSSEDPPEKASRVVPVYNFPLKPFVSITIDNLPPSLVGLRADGVLEISRFKKEFDQLDRTLASATSKYITYAFVKNGGMRVIRQDDGSDRQVFKNSGDRVFHVSVCTTATSAPPTDEQAVLGIGLTGAVYYATISKDGNDLFENDSLDAESLIFPPYPASDENSSNGALKTRVRRSSRHPEFFAIGRGKSIYLVWPATSMSTKYGVSGSNRTVDVEKLYNDRPLKVTTGKAGKDFVFSEDDTLIASLDKAGKLRFWDIRKLVNEANATASKVQAQDVNVPILSLATTSSAEKCWPTSVLFVDKIRPYTKGTALRYILVGLKQNHTLQLWDIALGKAVQELNFPHDSETDGICSVTYHPNSGIIVIGHPTRNSIFFLHLSAPRYTLPLMSQAEYLERIAVRDPDLPKPEATACISGMREMSFASKGQLRSVDLLPLQKAVDTPKEPKERVNAQALFELYVVHSRGVTCLAIKKEDLGWSPDSKVLHAIDDAVETGVVKLAQIKRVGNVEEVDTNGTAEPLQTGKVAKKKGVRASAEPPAEAADAKGRVEEFLPAPTTAVDVGPAANGVKGGEGHNPPVGTPSEKDKKKKKKSGANSILTAPLSQGADPSKSPSRSLSPNKTPIPASNLPHSSVTSAAIDTMASDQPPGSTWTPRPASTNQPVTPDNPEGWLNKEIKNIESSVSAEFNKQFDKLYRRIEDDRQVHDAAGTSRQEAVLRLVSSSLSTNVENALNRIIGQHMQQTVLPAISTVTAQTIHSQVGEAIARVLHSTIPHEIGTHLPVAISTAMQNPTHLRTLTESVSKRLNPSLETHFADLMRTTISPTFQKLAVAAAERVTIEIENRVGAKLQQYEIERQRDATKIDRLQASMHSMLEMMAHMTEGQIAFQERILKDRNTTPQPAEISSRPSSSAATMLRSTPVHSRQTLSAQPSPIAPPRKKSAEELEMNEIAALMDNGRYEEGSVRWLQSGRSIELFDNLFVSYTPEYLRHEVSPLVAFSVGITVANSFEHNVQARLDWIYTSLDTVDTRDPEMMSLSEHGPALLGNLITKLEQLYNSNPGRGRGDPALKRVPQIILKATEVKTQFGH